MKYYNIPIFVPHYGCPFDCVFCNQKHITGEREEVTGARAEEIIRQHLKTLPKQGRRVEAAFFGGSFTAVCPALQEELLAAAYKFLESGDIDGIRLSTRPDFIDDAVLERLMRYGVTTIELGVQSMDDTVLACAGRGHTAADVEKAVSVIRKYPVSLGLQMMTGLPGDTDERSIETARRIISLAPDCVRIYPTLVIRDTELCGMYERGEYMPQTLDAAVSLAARLIEMFRQAEIEIIRVGLAATDEISPGGALVAGPYHSAFGELAEGEIFYNEMLCSLGEDNAAVFAVNPRDISKAVGNSKRNIARFKERVEIIQDAGVPQGQVLRIK